MLSDDAKINLAKDFLRRKFTGENKLTSGQLETGKTYRIQRFIFGDNFVNVGAAVNASGQTFTASGTTPTVWTNASLLRELKLADLIALQEITYASATRTVTVTSSSSEGGSQSGETTFERAILSLAIEDLVKEFDPDYLQPAAQGNGCTIQFQP